MARISGHHVSEKGCLNLRPAVVGACFSASQSERSDAYQIHQTAAAQSRRTPIIILVKTSPERSPVIVHIEQTYLIFRDSFMSNPRQPYTTERFAKSCSRQARGR